MYFEFLQLILLVIVFKGLISSKTLSRIYYSKLFLEKILFII